MGTWCDKCEKWAIIISGGSSSSPVKQLKPPETAASSDHHLARTIEPSHSSFPAYPSHTTSGWICKSLTDSVSVVVSVVTGHTNIFEYIANTNSFCDRHFNI